jgi:hypothetical protein
MVFAGAVISGACKNAAGPAAPGPVTVQDGTAPYCVPPNPMPTAGVTHIHAEQIIQPSITFKLTSVEMYLQALAPYGPNPSGIMWLEIQGVTGGGGADGVAIANGISNTLNAAAVSTTNHTSAVFSFNNCSIIQNQPIAIVFKTDQDWYCSFARNDACPAPPGYVTGGQLIAVDDPTSGTQKYNNALVFLYGYQ